jgi:hypothetical protein
MIIILYMLEEANKSHGSFLLISIDLGAVHSREQTGRAFCGGWYSFLEYEVIWEGERHNIHSTKYLSHFHCILIVLKIFISFTIFS